jgi:NAD(P)-dependent dehydrogenase (short-subunit alcohol dehydrogenase family)
MMKKVVIFGATGGMGSAIARQLFVDGYQLHLVGRDEERLRAIAEMFDADFTVGEVEDPFLYDRVATEAGDSIAGLVYAVGTLNLKSLQRISSDDMLQDFKVNALGAALAVQSLLPALKNNSQTSSVLLFSSVAVEQGFKMHTSISMAKGAVSGLTLALAAELAPRVRVNAIAPSLTETSMTSAMLSNEKMVEAIANMHALPRLGQPEDMAQLAAFLISDKSAWITGQIFGVDGGRSTLRIKS